MLCNAIYLVPARQATLDFNLSLCNYALITAELAKKLYNINIIIINFIFFKQGNKLQFSNTTPNEYINKYIHIHYTKQTSNQQKHTLTKTNLLMK